MAELNETGSREVETPKRRVSWFVYLATAMVAFCLLAMNARGVPDPDSFDQIFPNSGGPLVATCSYEHGWPMVWLDSQTPNVPEGISTEGIFTSGLADLSFADGWLFLVEAKSIRWGAMLINLVLTMLVLVSVYVVCKRRWRNGFRFSLLEICIGMVLVSFAFANYQHNRDISRREQDTTLAFSLSNPVWSSPKWLRRLIGEHAWMGVYRHFETVAISTANLDAETIGTIGKFPYLRELSIKGDPSRSQIELLGKLSQLEAIEIEYFIPIKPWKGTLVLSKEKVDETEAHESRIKKPNVTLPSIVELRIDSNGLNPDDWTRARNLIDCCPNLKRVNLTGDQYLTDDLMNLPATIERIEYGFLSTDEEVAKLKEAFPNATVEQKMKGMYMVNFTHWSIAEIRVNRRRKIGWWDSQFAMGFLDLSETPIDMAFAEVLRPVFSDAHHITFGEFDSSDTAIWITQQCPQLVAIDAREFELMFSDAMKLPDSIYALMIKQNSISADEFVKLINQLSLGKLRIKDATFDSSEMKKIRDANSSCEVFFEAAQEKMSELKLSPPLE